MLKDILGQAWEAMFYNRRRTAITMIGMAWGIATVVLLLAYGAGFSRALQAIFAEWGTHTIGVFPGRTSEQAGGDKAGAWVRFTLDDVDRVTNGVSGITSKNSSPPHRPRMSDSRSDSRPARANSFNTWSPVACPQRSLMALK